MTETQDQSFKYWEKSGRSESLKSQLLMILSSRFDMTDRELSDTTGEDINAINRARYDLVNEGYVCESQKRRCSITHHYVQSWRLGNERKEKTELTQRELNHFKKMYENMNDHQKQLAKELILTGKWFE